jgi:phage minor structural protein
MIRAFGKTDRDFSSNGDIIVKATKAKLHKVDNGDFYVDIDANIEYAGYLIDGNILAIDTPQGAQAFRVSNPTKKGNKVSCRAWHVFYDSKNYLIADSNVVDKNCNDALDHLNSATEPLTPFITMRSDVTTIDSFRCVRKSLYEAIQTVLERWGGHLVRDNWRVEVRNSIGNDNGVVVRYRKNLKEITSEENWDNVVTKLLPVGKDGILLNDQDASASLYVTSSTQYPIPYTKTVSFSQDSVNEDDYKDASGNVNQAAYRTALVNDLRQQAQAYVEKNSIPQVNYTLKANVDKITDVGDVVEVIDERLGLDLLTNIISFDYDLILNKYTEIEFGNFKKTISGFVSNVQNNIDSTLSGAVSSATGIITQSVADNITNSFISSYVLYDGSKILVVDAIPKEEARNVILINNNGIAFSDSGINGTFKSAWSIDGTLNMQEINVINLICDMIKGGTLKLGSALNQSGKIELYNNSNKLVCTLDKNGLIMYATNGGYVVLNADVGLVGYDSVGNPIYWVSDDEFHMNKAVVENDITVGGKVRFIPITISDSNGNVTNDGVGIVANYTKNEE